MPSYAPDFRSAEDAASYWRRIAAGFAAAAGSLGLAAIVTWQASCDENVYGGFAIASFLSLMAAAESAAVWYVAPWGHDLPRAPAGRADTPIPAGESPSLPHALGAGSNSAAAGSHGPRPALCANCSRLRAVSSEANDHPKSTTSSGD